MSLSQSPAQTSAVAGSNTQGQMEQSRSFAETLRSGLEELSSRLPASERLQAIVGEQLAQMGAQLRELLSDQIEQTSGQRIQFQLLPKTLSAEDALRIVSDLCHVPASELKQMADAFSWVEGKITTGATPLIKIDEDKISYPWMHELLSDVRSAAPGWDVALNYRWSSLGSTIVPEVILQLAIAPKQEPVKDTFASAIQMADQQREEEEQARNEKEKYRKILISSVQTVVSETAFLALGSFALPTAVQRVRQVDILDEPLQSVTRVCALAIGGFTALFAGVASLTAIGNPGSQIYLGSLLASNLISLGLEISRYASREAKRHSDWG